MNQHEKKSSRSSTVRFSSVLSIMLRAMAEVQLSIGGCQTEGSRIGNENTLFFRTMQPVREQSSLQ